MKRKLALLIAAMTCAAVAHAAGVKITAVTTTGPKAKPATTFAADTPTIHALFKTTGAKKGDSVRGVWIAEDVGEKAPANTKIDEKTLVLERDTEAGDLSLSKPTAGWPPGKYRVELYAGDDLATTVKFTIGDGEKKAARPETPAAEKRFGGSANKTIKFPANDPAFTVELPANWTHSSDKDGNLECKAGNDETYAFSILNLEGVQNKQGLRAALPDLANTMAKAMEIDNFEVGDIETDKNGNDISFTGIAGTGESDGIEFAVMVHAFEPQKGKFYAIATAGTKESDAKHEKDYDAITASITPLED